MNFIHSSSNLVTFKTLCLLRSEEEIEQTVREAKEFGVKAFQSATQKMATENIARGKRIKLGN